MDKVARAYRITEMNFLHLSCYTNPKNAVKVGKLLIKNNGIVKIRTRIARME